jgi:DNA-binding GntR family transcriptional regulator
MKTASKDRRRATGQTPPADPKPLKTYTEAICQYLRDAVLSHHIKPSERLHEKAIARQFGVSITPVREAIRKLEGEGYLEVRVHRGVTVRAISEEELIEIYRVIGVLDSFAATLAMTRMGPEEFRELQDRTDEMDAYFRERKVMECLHASTRIHSLIWTFSGNRFLAHTLGRIQARMLHYPMERNALHSRPGVLRKSVESHRKILKALKGGKREEVEDTCRKHWTLLEGRTERR